MIFGDIGSTALEPRSVTANELLDNYQLLEVRSDVIVVGQRGQMLAEPTPGAEIGSSRSTWGNLARDEYNPRLQGLAGLEHYDEMRKSDAQVQMSLLLKKTPVLAARWYIQPGGTAKRDKKIADQIWRNLTRDMTVSWPQLLTESLLMLDFGYYAFEKVFDVYPDGKIKWRKFAARHPMDIQEWVWDRNGGPRGFYMYKPEPILPYDNIPATGVTSSYQGSNMDGDPRVFIPIDKLLVFTHGKEGGNIQGVSALRSASLHHYYKSNLYKIDGIQKERHAVGVPVVRLPQGYTSEDKAAAAELGRNIRVNEKSHITLPPGWEIMMLKLEGLPVDIMQSIQHHDEMIARNVLGSFMVGDASQGTAQAQFDMFMKGTRFIADIVRDTFNKWAIPELVRWNWGENVDPPELRVRRIGEIEDWRTISFTLRNLVGAGLLQVDEPLLEAIREEFDLPTRDPESIIEQITPQAPGGPGQPGQSRVGPPRQAPAGKTQVTPGRNGVVGQDRSGK